MSDKAPGRKTGRIMMILAWIAGLAVAMHFFSQWEARRYNPNQSPVSQHSGNAIEVTLESNSQGHYLLNGRINQQEVTFIIDTGASQVSIPAEIAEKIGLKPGSPITLNTANGRATGHRTEIETLSLGDIQLHGVQALIVPNMGKSYVLLGMSALNHLEFTQRSGTLLLRQYIDQ